MRLLSFVDEKNQWIPIEVELELWPGLPEIHFLGRPDQHLRESARRIKSAIRSQGFDFPVGQQILVNLRPSYIKKSSRGVELAVAAAYLMESGQIPKWVPDSHTYFYGELSLTGEVSVPEGLHAAQLPMLSQVVTGPAAQAGFPFVRLEVQGLKALTSPERKDASPVQVAWQPEASVMNLQITASWARFLGVVALGGHSLLLAGPSGSGKTTAGRILHSLLAEPTDLEKQELLRAIPAVSDISEKRWRPLIQPHHTIPIHSLLGGGSEAHGGELARCDLGLLLLDEFFEFSPAVADALREPIEQKRMRISRGRRVHEYPVRAQVVATTNLCPCGDFVPGERMRSCRFSLLKCRSYSQKISGPLLDRFQILMFTRNLSTGEQKLSVRELLQRLQAIRLRLAQAGVTRDESIEALSARLSPLLRQDWQEQVGSERRRIATLKVAQSLADWEGSDRIRGPHLQEALVWTAHSFEKLRRWDFGSACSL